MGDLADVLAALETGHRVLQPGASPPRLEREAGFGPEPSLHRAWRRAGCTRQLSEAADVARGADDRECHGTRGCVDRQRDDEAPRPEQRDLVVDHELETSAPGRVVDPVRQRPHQFVQKGGHLDRPRGRNRAA